MKVYLIAAFLAVSPVCSFAQSGAPSDCSGTVGQTSAPVAFPSSGNTGPSRPTAYVTIENPASPGTTPVLAINPNGAAVIGGSGSLPIYPGGSQSWAAGNGYPPPATMNIIASASSTPYSCKYQ